MYKIIVFIHKVTEIQRRKKFSILCFTQQLVIEPEGVLNRYEICMIPYSIVAWTSENLMDYDTLLLLCVTSLLGTIVYMLVTLAIFPMFYLMLDFPNLTVMELFKKSFQIMKGNCIRYLLLQLSFVPIMFLSIFICGIPLLWTIPYMNVTCTNFYLDIMACRNRQMQQS